MYFEVKRGFPVPGVDDLFDTFVGFVTAFDELLEPACHHLIESRLRDYPLLSFFTTTLTFPCVTLFTVIGNYAFSHLIVRVNGVKTLVCRKLVERCLQKDANRRAFCKSFVLS